MSTPGQPGTSVTSAIVPTDSLGHNIPNLVPVVFAPDGVIFQPGATYPNASKWGGNRSNDFTLLCGVAKAAHGIPIRIDSSITTALAAGTYDFGPGCTFAGYTPVSELDTAAGVIFTSFPILLGQMFITIDGDTDPLWTVVSDDNRQISLFNTYLFANGAASVIHFTSPSQGGQTDVYADGPQCFFDTGSIHSEDALINIHLTGGASFVDGAFTKSGVGQLVLFIDDWRSAAALIDNAPDLSIFDQIQNNSGQLNLTYQSSSTFGLVTQVESSVGPWSIAFSLTTDLDTAFNLRGSEGVEGTWLGSTYLPVTLGTVTGIQIVPPEVFTLQNLAFNAQATDVSVFAPTQATRIVLEATTWQGNAGKAAIFTAVASIIQTLEMRRGSQLQAVGNSAVFVANLGTLVIEAWEGSIIIAGAIGLASGEGVTTTLEIDVRGEGCVIDASYGSAIYLFPGVLFAASGDPITVGVTPTDVGCLYLDSGTGIEWTYDGEVWKQVNPQIVTNAIPLGDLQAGGATSTLIKDLTGILPADTKVSLCETQIVAQLAAIGLVGVAITLQSSSGDVDGSLGSIGSAGTIPAVGFYAGGSNPYPSRGGVAITAKIVLTGAQFANLTAGSLTFRLLKQVLPDG